MKDWVREVMERERRILFRFKERKEIIQSVPTTATQPIIYRQCFPANKLVLSVCMGSYTLLTTFPAVCMHGSYTLILTNVMNYNIIPQALDCLHFSPCDP